MSLGITVICVVTYCYVDFVVMATEVELYTYSYGKIGFYRGNKQTHLLGCHFKVYKAHVWCISFFDQHGDLIKLKLLEYDYHSNGDTVM